jgi:hypothetical protein
LYEARNMAINWAIGNDWNVSIWVYFDSSIDKNNEVKIFSYPYNINNTDITYIEGNDVKLLKTLIFRKWIQLDDIEWKTNLLFVFDAITWNLKYYTWVWLNRTTIDLNNPDININISYNGSISENLNKTINYFTNTNIIDY